jgi:hypothetical protein
LHFLDESERIVICHSPPRNLLKRTERAIFIKEFAAAVKFVFSDSAAVGYIRPGGDEVLGPRPEEDEEFSDDEADVEPLPTEEPFPFYGELNHLDIEEEDIAMVDHSDDEIESSDQASPMAWD